MPAFHQPVSNALSYGHDDDWLELLVEFLLLIKCTTTFNTIINVMSPMSSTLLFSALIAYLQFRLVIVLASDREPLTSEQSAAIQTLPSGLPSSPPIHLQAVVLDANRISISWDPPLYPNGPLVSYSLTIQEASFNLESYHGSQVKKKNLIF